MQFIYIVKLNLNLNLNTFPNLISPSSVAADFCAAKRMSIALRLWRLVRPAWRLTKECTAMIPTISRVVQAEALAAAVAAAAVVAAAAQAVWWMA